jgi:hypothetical protein
MECTLYQLELFRVLNWVRFCLGCKMNKVNYLGRPSPGHRKLCTLYQSSAPRPNSTSQSCHRTTATPHHATTLGSGRLRANHPWLQAPLAPRTLGHPSPCRPLTPDLSPHPAANPRLRAPPPRLQAPSPSAMGTSGPLRPRPPSVLLASSA